MNPDRSRADPEENVLVVDVPDDALERAAGSCGAAALTWNYYTYNYYQCGPIAEQA
jgi:hypothetical protein